MYGTATIVSNSGAVPTMRRTPSANDAVAEGV